MTQNYTLNLFNPDAIVVHLAQVLLNSPSTELLHVVLTGGGAGQAINERLGSAAAAVTDEVWQRVHLWWGDERFVPVESVERNDAKIVEVLGPFYAADRVHRVAFESDTTSVVSAASTYAHELGRFGKPSPLFSVVMLGLGPDGHVASLFPESKQLHSNEPCVGIVDSPKLPPERVTMTFPTLNNALRTWIFAPGANKSDAFRHLVAECGSVQQTPARGITSASDVQVFR